MEVPVYRWMPPEDLAPVDRLLDALLGHGLDAITFTSAPAAASLLRRAEERGQLGDVVATLNDVGAIVSSPVVSVNVGAVTENQLDEQFADVAQAAKS